MIAAYGYLTVLTFVTIESMGIPFPVHFAEIE